MADRLSAFSDPEIIALITESFIPVADNDWYSRRRDDEVGRFFRSVADQGPRKGDGGSTRQGIYAFTPSGRLLGYNNNRDPERKKEMMKDALAQWNDLPDSERLPDVAAIPTLTDAQLDDRYHREPPEGGIVLRTFTRTLEDDGSGKLIACSAGPDGSPLGTLSAFDHAWIREPEWRELVALARDSAENAPVAFPAPLAIRIARFHLVDNTRGEPPMWRREDIRDSEMTIRRVTKGTGTGDGTLRLAIEGRVLLASAADPGDADRGFEAEIRGEVAFDPASDAIARFDMVALGRHWGEGTYTRGARPGRTPLVVAFELADGSQAGDRVPPQASTWLQGYFEADRH